MLIVFMGSSAVGKDTLLNLISKKYNIPICVSSTTRPMREGEIDGREYHFISNDKFKEDFENSKFIEYRQYSTANGTWYYGLSKDSVDIFTNQLVIVDQQGYYSLVQEYGQENVLGILLVAPEKIKIKRALSRETRADKKFYEEFYRRMLDDINAFNEVILDRNVFKVQNIELEDAKIQIESILFDKGVIKL